MRSKVFKICKNNSVNRRFLYNFAFLESIDELCSVLGLDMNMPDPDENEFHSDSDQEGGNKKSQKGKKVMRMNPLAAKMAKKAAATSTDKAVSENSHSHILSVEIDFK